MRHLCLLKMKGAGSEVAAAFCSGTCAERLPNTTEGCVCPRWGCNKPIDLMVLVRFGTVLCNFKQQCSCSLSNSIYRQCVLLNQTSVQKIEFCHKQFALQITKCKQHLVHTEKIKRLTRTVIFICLSAASQSSTQGRY